MRDVIDADLVRRLVASQFPQWAPLPVVPVVPNGWDNRTFRLGDAMAVRLPSAPEYASQVEKEQRWLPRLRPFLPVAVPTPLALGRPGEGYPWQWSIYGWLDGEIARRERIADLPAFASSLAGFLEALQAIDPGEGPLAGAGNFHRGGAIAVYDLETRRAMSVLADRIDVRAATRVWEAALATTWTGSPVWIHGDVSAGNLLVRDGRLCGVIDFGMLAIGDPACDLAIAWTFLDARSRSVFRSALAPDADTWARGRGWALWKALIVAAEIRETNEVETASCWKTLEEALSGV